LSSDEVLEGSYNLVVTFDYEAHTTSHNVWLVVLPPDFIEDDAETLANSTETTAPKVNNEEEKKQIAALVKAFRKSIINKQNQALLDQGSPNDKNYTEPVAPEPFISKFTQTGWIEITFSQDMFLVPKSSMITNGTIEVD